MKPSKSSRKQLFIPDTLRLFNQKRKQENPERERFLNQTKKERKEFRKRNRCPLICFESGELSLDGVIISWMVVWEP